MLFRVYIWRKGSAGPLSSHKVTRHRLHKLHVYDGYMNGCIASLICQSNAGKCRGSKESAPDSEACSTSKALALSGLWEGEAELDQACLQDTWRRENTGASCSHHTQVILRGCTLGRFRARSDGLSPSESCPFSPFHLLISLLLLRASVLQNTFCKHLLQVFSLPSHSHHIHCARKVNSGPYHTLLYVTVRTSNPIGPPGDAHALCRASRGLLCGARCMYKGLQKCTSAEWCNECPLSPCFLFL